MRRLDFLKGAAATLGCGAFGCGFLQSGALRGSLKPNLVFGVISDTHLRTLKSRPPPRPWWPDTFLRKALGYFRDANVDAVVHCGDMANYGEVEAMRMHADIWNATFPRSRAPDGHVVEKLFVTGNHDAEGENANARVRKLYSDPETRAREVLSADMAGNWERIWGEPYEEAWHKVVKGYHFFGAHWKVDRMRMMRLVRDALSGEAEDAARPARPFFLLTHSRLMPPERNAIAAFKDRALAFFGHDHESSTNWSTIYYEPNTFPRIQVPPCISPDWDLKFRGEANVTKFPLLGKEKAGRCRQGFLVEVYDDKVVIRRREFAEGGSLGPDWVMPLGETGRKCHPFSKESLKKVIGEPQFRAGAKLAVEMCCQETASPRLCVKIPLADGNPDSRVYAYEVEVAGETGLLHKAVYAAGCNMGIGHEPNNGITTLEIPYAEISTLIPQPSSLITVSVRPLTSLGTVGGAISAVLRGSTPKTIRRRSVTCSAWFRTQELFCKPSAKTGKILV